jgi:hypothetical protein
MVNIIAKNVLLCSYFKILEGENFFFENFFSNFKLSARMGSWTKKNGCVLFRQNKPNNQKKFRHNELFFDDYMCDI